MKERTRIDLHAEKTAIQPLQLPFIVPITQAITKPQNVSTYYILISIDFIGEIHRMPLRYSNFKKVGGGGGWDS